jgi:hypothetical protein
MVALDVANRCVAGRSRARGSESRGIAGRRCEHLRRERVERAAGFGRSGSQAVA